MKCERCESAAVAIVNGLSLCGPCFLGDTRRRYASQNETPAAPDPIEPASERAMLLLAEAISLLQLRPADVVRGRRHPRPLRASRKQRLHRQS